MKKAVLVLVVVSVFASSCSTYTCPTYSNSKEPKKMVIKESSI